jgi:hypothetical protein
MSAAARICEAAKTKTSPTLTKEIVAEKRWPQRDEASITAETAAVRIVARFAKVLAIMA